jgi:hypothetical protein
MNPGRAAGNGHRVLEQLYEQSIMSVKDMRALLGTTFAGANQIAQRLVDLKILAEIPSGRTTPNCQLSWESRAFVGGGPSR